MKRKLTALFLVLSLVGTMALAGCGEKAETKIEGTINIGYQLGMSYAPFYVMQELKIIEKYLPNVKVNYTTFGSGLEVTEALTSNKIDVGVLGVAPFLTAWAKDIDIKVFSGLVNTPLGLVVNDAKYLKLKDIKNGTDKIAVPAPGSIQDILLAMAAQKELGNAKAFEKSILTMKHPDAMNSLLYTKNIIGHYSSPPYLYEELAKGGKLAVDGFETFGGDFSFLVSVATKKFYEESPAYAGAVYMAISEAINLINNKDDATIKVIMAKEKLTKAKTISYLNKAGTNYTTTPYGMTGLAKFMKQAGFLTKVPAKYTDYCWGTVTATIGQRAGEASVVEKAQNRK